MTENKELLPCPFCGRLAEYKDPRNRYAGCTSESLEECNISGTAFKVINWNTRAESPKLDIAVKALEESINFIDNLDGEFIERALMLEKLQSALQQIKG